MSLVLAPVEAASVLPVWRRSRKPNPAMPTLLVARRRAVYSVARRNGAPLDVVLADHWQDVRPKLTFVQLASARP